MNKRKEACLCFSFYCNQDKEWRVGFLLWSSLLLLLLLLLLILSLLPLLLPLPLTIVIVVLIIQILAYFEGGHFFYIPVHLLIRIFLTSFCSTPCRHSKIMGLIYWKYVYQIKIARCSISGNGIVRIFLEQKVKILITPFWFQRPLSERIWFELLVILIAKMC